MAGVYGSFVDASGEPCVGVVSFTPAEVRGAGDEDILLGGSRVDVVLDEDGEFDIDLEGGNYRADIRLKRASTYTREISVPDGGQVNLKWLLSGNAAMPSEQSEAFTAAGPYSFQIPWWATKIDVVLVGAGGGGDDGASGLGGGPGFVVSKTLVRGVDVSWDSPTISGTVGVGGASDAGSGTATSATAVGMTALTAAGGTGGGSASSVGMSPGNVTFNGVLYKGGAAQSVKSAAGIGPGGGGGGGTATTAGGVGADGAAFFRALK